jgi:trk system potassium uptake protein TrkH
VPGPTSDSIEARVRDTSLLMWKIYVGFSIILTGLLLIEGMSVFDALCHMFATMATGGFSTRNLSIGYYHSVTIEVTLMIFMILASFNFTLFAMTLRGRWQSLFRDRELRAYLCIIIAAVTLITIDLKMNQALVYTTVGQALRAAGFNLVSCITTTGFAVGDFNTWPNFSRWLMIVIMFVGGCAGSTSGAIKVIRFVLFFRILGLEIERLFRPHVVRPLKLGGQVVDDSTRRSIGTYIALHLGLALVGITMIMILQNPFFVKGVPPLDIETAFSSVLATLNNVGPALGPAGAMGNFGFYCGPAKLLFALLMICGRLEILVILSLFIPSFWRRN